MDKTAGKKAAKYWLAAALPSASGCRFTYWQIPYARCFAKYLVRLGITDGRNRAAAARAFGKARFLMVFFIVGATVLCRARGGVAVETNKDPTSHNLWPFESL